MKTYTDEDRAVLLRIFSEVVRRAPADIVGAVTIRDDALSLCGDRLRVRPVLIGNTGDAPSQIVHAHFVAEFVGRASFKPLEGCVVAFGDKREETFLQLAEKWLHCVCPPILSLLHGREVLGASHFDGSESWGVSRRHGFVGPLGLGIFVPPEGKTLPSEELTARREEFLRSLTDCPIYAGTAELVDDAELHLVKVTLNYRGDHLERSLEIDDHRIQIPQSPWTPGPKGMLAVEEGSAAIVSAYALFFKPEDYRPKTESEKLDDRLERAVGAFVQEPRPEFDIDVLAEGGIDRKTAEDIHAFLPIAFGRLLLDRMKVVYPDEYVLINRDGGFRKDLPLWDEPVYRRAMLLAPGFAFSQRYGEAFKYVALCSAEIDAVNNALNAGSKPEDLVLGMPLVVEPGTDRQTFEKAFRVIYAEERARHKKATKKWWQFWK